MVTPLHPELLAPMAARLSYAQSVAGARIVGGAATRDKMDGTRLPTPYPHPRCVTNRSQGRLLLIRLRFGVCG